MKTVCDALESGFNTQVVHPRTDSQIGMGPFRWALQAYQSARRTPPRSISLSLIPGSSSIGRKPPTGGRTTCRQCQILAVRLQSKDPLKSSSSPSVKVSPETEYTPCRTESANTRMDRRNRHAVDPQIDTGPTRTPTSLCARYGFARVTSGPRCRAHNLYRSW
jgi:hypothetical protein